MGALLGTVVEYYDYSLYGFCAAILAEKFFPAKDKIDSLMYVFAAYALSYCAKPFGAVFFSRIGDKYGRKMSLKITILGISIPTLLIGLLPEYSVLGTTSMTILILCRFFQGFFAGGEYDGAAIYVIEHLGVASKYTASGFTRATGVLGLLLGIAATNFFTSSIFPEWGWRIPFLLSMPMALLTIYYRSFLEETPIFIEHNYESPEFSGIFKFIRSNWQILILMIFLAGSFGITYQVSIIFMKQYLPMVIPSAQQIISSFSVIIVLCFGVVMPIAGIIADRVGSMLVIASCTVGTLLSCVLFLLAIEYELLNLGLCAVLLIAIFIAPFNALAHGSIIHVFKTKERYRGIGIGHTIGSLLMSGTANYACLFMIKNYHFTLFPVFYIAVFTIFSYLILKLINNHLALGRKI